jgi:hypothetical protein
MEEKNIKTEGKQFFPLNYDLKDQHVSSMKTILNAL